MVFRARGSFSELDFGTCGRDAISYRNILGRCRVVVQTSILAKTIQDCRLTILRIQNSGLSLITEQIVGEQEAVVRSQPHFKTSKNHLGIVALDLDAYINLKGLIDDLNEDAIPSIDTIGILPPTPGLQKSTEDVVLISIRPQIPPTPSFGQMIYIRHLNM